MTQDLEQAMAPCLVLNTRTGQWSVENRPLIPPRIPPQFEWSSELESAAKFYQKNGEKSGAKSTI